MIIVTIQYLFFCFIWLSASIDADLIKAKGYFHDHSARFLQGGMFVWLLSLFAAEGQIIEQFKLFGLYSAIFYATFDYVLNIQAGKPILYTGNTSLIDRLWSGKPYLQLAFKSLLLIIFTLLNILT